MYGIIVVALLLANAKSDVSVTTEIGGSGAVVNHIETSVNGNITTVDSDKPGSVTVIKTDETEQITAEPPVTIAHTQPPADPTPVFHDPPYATPSPIRIHNNYWITLLQFLWVHLHKFF